MTPEHINQLYAKMSKKYKVPVQVYEEKERSEIFEKNCTAIGMRIEQWLD